MVLAIVIAIMLLLLGVGVLVLIHVYVTGRIIRGGLANSTMIERGSMSQDDLEKLPCFDFKEREKGTSPVDCTVCLENFKVGERCRLLPLCKHSFHAECVDSWLLRTPVCPICRTCADFLKDGSVSGEESSQFIGSLIELREIQTPELGNISDETTIELEDSQITKSSHLSDTSSIEVRERGQSSGIDGHETDS